MSLKKILIVDDEPLIRWTLSQALSDWNFLPVEADNIKSALRLFETEQPAVVLLDINLTDGSGLDLLRTIKQRQSNTTVIMITANVSVEYTISAMRSGASDFIGKPINLDELQKIIKSCFNGGISKKLSEKINREPGFEQIIGESEEMKAVISLARKVAKSDVSSILLQGESGTGKDQLAKAIHSASSRAGKPFIAINCAAIPEQLIESELFGHEKGSFTDAKTAKEGLFEQAKGGTIFLDEIGELELGLQAKLLRVLEEGVFRRVGGLGEIPLEAQVIAASNRNLREQSDAGLFRRDLYYRLSVIEINIPPLRDRSTDVLLLATHFIKLLDRCRFQSKPRRLAPEVVEVFRRYEWAGNIRELKNAIERALILEEGDQITLKYLPVGLSLHNYSATSERNLDLDSRFQNNLPREGISLESVVESLIEQALMRTQGNVTRAAALLNLSRDQMRYYLKKKDGKIHG
jgi:two-component system, NtrC family, response regulator AtoC